MDLIFIHLRSINDLGSSSDAVHRFVEILPVHVDKLIDFLIDSYPYRIQDLTFCSKKLLELRPDLRDYFKEKFFDKYVKIIYTLDKYNWDQYHKNDQGDYFFELFPKINSKKQKLKHWLTLINSKNKLIN